MNSLLFKVIPHSPPYLKVSIKDVSRGWYGDVLTWCIAVLVGCVAYFTIIFGGRALMTNYKPLPCKFFFQIHNILLTLVSGALLALLFEQLLPQLYHHGLYWTICSEKAWTPQLELIYYLNYLVKWWELVDTGFLVIKKKKLGKFSKTLEWDTKI